MTMERGIITITENGLVAIPTAPVWMTHGINYDVYSLEMVIAVSFKLRSRESVAFRRFIMGKLYAANRKEPLYLFFSPAAYIRKAPSC